MKKNKFLFALFALIFVGCARRVPADPPNVDPTLHDNPKNQLKLLKQMNND